MCDPGVGRPGRKGPKIEEGSTHGRGREKPNVFLRRPYRKPTQVDRKRILRPTGEG